MIKWMSQKDILKAALCSFECAKKASLLHWETILKAGPSVYRKAYDADLVGADWMWCGLCQHFSFKYGKKERCSKCPLYESGFDCCREWVILIGHVLREAEQEDSPDTEWSREATYAFEDLILRIQEC
ncbi:MAG: hypothetical protein KAR40_06210 [Candidatus Sabulitectum sp.]|nr:hypothetical protein [Candidatus Sabulitectum sp.]